MKAPAAHVESGGPCCSRWHANSATWLLLLLVVVLLLVAMALVDLWAAAPSRHRLQRCATRVRRPPAATTAAVALVGPDLLATTTRRCSTVGSCSVPDVMLVC